MWRKLTTGTEPPCMRRRQCRTSAAAAALRSAQLAPVLGRSLHSPQPRPSRSRTLSACTERHTQAMSSSVSEAPQGLMGCKALQHLDLSSCGEERAEEQCSLSSLEVRPLHCSLVSRRRHPHRHLPPAGRYARRTTSPRADVGRQALAQCRSLQLLRLCRLSELRDVSTLSAFGSALISLDLSCCVDLADLRGAGGCKSLRTLVLKGCRSLRTLGL